MLTRLYIDNFRCFEKFEWRPGRKVLILGQNGTGKSSLMDALRYVRLVAARDFRASKWFKLEQRTRWLRQSRQVFELDAQLGKAFYQYRLELEPRGDAARLGIGSEEVSVDGRKILEFSNGRVTVYQPGEEVRAPYELDRGRSALASVPEDSNVPELPKFRNWLGQMGLWRINPFDMTSRSERELMRPSYNIDDMAGWYRHLVQAHPRENEAFIKSLRESLDGFNHLRLADAGENVRILYADFVRRNGSTQIAFHELSEGQRCLVCLYAIVHFVVARGGTVIIDEPDNFLSLREIQPWLMAVEDMADDHQGQVILISHHPEILNQWAGPYGVQFVREGAGAVHVEKFKGNPEYSLSASELIARGWERD